MQRVYLRRRIVAGAIALGVVVLIVLLLTRGGGRGTKVGTGRTTTTSAPASTTTVAPQLVVAPASWRLPVPLARSVVLTVNTNLGVFGGLTTGNASDKVVYQIDPVTGISTQIGTMASAVHDAAGGAIGTSYYVFGGGGTTETAAVQQFSFSNSSHLTGTAVANLPAKRADSGAVTVNGQILLVGGFDGKKWLPEVLSTTDGTTFATVAQLAPAVRYPAVATVNGKLYVIGGELSPNQADATNIQQVDLQSFAVTSLSPLPSGLSHAAAVTLNNTIYVFGGRSGGHAIDTISVLNPTTGQLQVVGHLPAARSDMGVALVGQTVYLVGGENESAKPVNTVVTARLSAP